jgi:hypothetical protein
VPANGGDGDWEALQPFASLPQIEWTDPNVRFLDLDGDGLDDVPIAKDDTFVWYPSLGGPGSARHACCLGRATRSAGPRSCSLTAATRSRSRI